MAFVETLSVLLDQAPAWVTAVTATISAASAIAALTPTPADDRVLSRIVRILDLLALNVGHARRGQAARNEHGK